MVIRVALTTMLALSAAGAADQNAEDPNQAVLAYRLTVEKLEQLGQAYRALAEAAKADPAAAARMRKQEQSEDSDGPQTISDIVKQYESAGPKVTAAITGTGLTVREFVVGNLALMQAMMAVELLKHAPKLPDNINKENVAFLQKNEPAVKALTAAMQKLKQR